MKDVIDRDQADLLPGLPPSLPNPNGVKESSSLCAFDECRSVIKDDIFEKLIFI